jgi:hypothetical protein
LVQICCFAAKKQKTAKEAQNRTEMLDSLISLLRGAGSGNACFCTLAIHPPYRRRAQLLCSDAPNVPWIVFTDEPDDFAGLSVCVVRHLPTGPMAIDYQTRIHSTGNGRGSPAYHDKRFVIEAALREFDTAIFVDADSRIRSLPPLPSFSAGIAVNKESRTSISEHLSRYGPARRPSFEQLAVHLTGDVEVLNSARWCNESLFAVTRDGRESKFFEQWGAGAEFLQARGVFSGEGGVIGLAAECAGWTVDYKTLAKLASAIQHEGRGPKSD